jgi:hypothetical protein
MSNNKFLSDANVQMLWEVLIDEDSITKDRRTQEAFTRTLPEFYEREKSNPQRSLIDLNKQFISIMMKLLIQDAPDIPKNQFSQFPQQAQQTHKKILITQEEIQLDRVSHFEQELGKKQNEFSKAMAVPVPETPVFKDNIKDEPLSEINMIIQRTIAERNLDIEKIHKSANKVDAENWLKSAPTSIKEEKAEQKATALKTIKIEKGELNAKIQPEELTETSNANPGKQISWGTNTTFETRSNTDGANDSIFSKLKLTSPIQPSPQETPTRDIVALYAYIKSRFDKLEELLREQRR